MGVGDETITGFGVLERPELLDSGRASDTEL
jgi:hypothetical protein